MSLKLSNMKDEIGNAIWWLGASLEFTDIDEVRRCIGNALQALSSK